VTGWQGGTGVALILGSVYHAQRSGVMTSGTFSASALILLVQSEYLATPGLRLTPAQAARDFGLEPDVCHTILATLADAGVIGRAADGAFVRWFPRVMGVHPTAAYAPHAA
jgi:hypothetical protein